MAGVTVKFSDGSERNFPFDTTYETNKLTQGQKAVTYDAGFVLIHCGDVVISYPSEKVAEVDDQSQAIIQKYRGR